MGRPKKRKLCGKEALLSSESTFPTLDNHTRPDHIPDSDVGDTTTDSYIPVIPNSNTSSSDVAAYMMVEDKLQLHSSNDMVAGSQSCVCLSAMYLTLANLQSMQDFTFPPSLHLLRTATATGWDVLHCGQCPILYLSAMQNIQLLGLLIVSLAERYDKLLKSIDDETERCDAANEMKTFRVGDTSLATAHMHTGQLDCPASFLIELQSSEWRTMVKKVIRADVHGSNGEGSLALLNLIDKMEERQHGWHVAHPVRDAPPCERPSAGEQPMCLTLVREAKRIIRSLDFD
ncbi:hypothetical protein AAFC00_005325 [Neodothiora populina]|uniref:Uncharacterized protein n=1 Tax=Neodothiora populina TaxID=2781224 RepID=A0ABR3PKS1_9PEZI